MFLCFPPQILSFYFTYGENWCQRLLQSMVARFVIFKARFDRILGASLTDFGLCLRRRFIEVNCPYFSALLAQNIEIILCRKYSL